MAIIVTTRSLDVAFSTAMEDCPVKFRSRRASTQDSFTAIRAKSQEGELPPPLHPRRSLALSDEHIAREVEVFDPSTSELTKDIPGPAFGLNEHRGGEFMNGTLLLIVHLESGGKGVVGSDLKTGDWVQDGTCANLDSCSSNTLQLVALKNGKNVYLFSEREQGEHCKASTSEHYIDENLPDTTRGWTNVDLMKTSDSSSLLVYPEQTCVGFGERKLCMFNAPIRDGEVYDMRNGETLLLKTSAAICGKQFFTEAVRILGATNIPSKIFLALGVLCNSLPRGNAHQLTGSSNAVDPAAWPKGAFVAALLAGGLGAALFLKRFFCSPPTFSVDAGLEASPAELGRRISDLDCIYPPIDECWQ